MAAVVFSSLGHALGGPFGAIAGGLAGAAIDSTLAGRRTTAAVEQIQQSAYGVSIPRVFGRARVAGILIWAHVTDHGAKGSGERGGSASIAIALSSRPIAEVRRVWADGREIRNAAGDFETPTVMRVHSGGERAPDPIIAATEGLERAPAYQGLAYVVFENLSLAPFGNRIPNLSFEIEADGDSIGDWLAEATELAGVLSAPMASPWDVAGYVASGGRIRDDVEVMMRLAGAHATCREGRLAIGAETAEHVIPRSDVLAVSGDEGLAAIEVISGFSGRPAAWSIGYLDAGRDYLAGLQRATRGRRGGHKDVQLPAVMRAADARMAAHAWLQEDELSAESIRLRLGWRWLGLSVGDYIRLADAEQRWRVTQCTIRGMEVHVVASGIPARPTTPLVSESGRIFAEPMQIVPPTRLNVFELSGADGGRMLHISANGDSGWRGCDVSLLRSWEQVQIGVVRTRRPEGVLVAPLLAGSTEGWDEDSVVVVALRDAAMTLESRTAGEVLVGANLLRAGREFLRFRTALPLGGGRFELRGLLRDCLQTLGEAAGQPAGATVELVQMAEFPGIAILPAMIGQTLLICAEGRGDPPGGTIIEYPVE